MISDTHAHLNWESYQDDLPEVLQRAKDKDLGLIINVGVDLPTSKEVAKQAKTIKAIPVLATIGMHPHEAQKYQNPQNLNQAIQELERLYRTNPEQVIAIGECGLDYYFSQNPGFVESEVSTEKLIELQKQLYLEQVKLAKKLNLPLVIHCRNSKPEENFPLAWNDIFVPELQNAKGVFHNFSGTETDAKTALDLGFYLSFSCVITYPKNEHLREIIKKLPFERIVTETDCPFLPPQQIRGQRNEPANVSEVVKVIAQVRGLNYEKAAQQTFTNAQKLFLSK